MEEIVKETFEMHIFYVKYGKKIINSLEVIPHENETSLIYVVNNDHKTMNIILTI